MAQGVTSTGRACLVAGLAGLLAGACTDSSPAPEPTTPATEFHQDIGVAVDLADYPRYEGTDLYLLAGPDVRTLDVYLVGFDREVERLTRSVPDLGVSFMSASGSLVVMADAATGRDELTVLDGTARRPLPGEPPGSRGFSPTLSPDGLLVYARLRPAGDTADDATPFELVTRDGVDGDPTVQLRSEGPVAGVWGPDGTIVVRSHPGRADPEAAVEVMLLDPETGETTLLEPELDQAATLVSHPAARQVVIGDPAGGEAGLLDVRTGEWTPLPSGWTGLCFDPYGERLLVGRGGDLALLDPAEPDGPTLIGETHGGSVGRCSWVAG
ncbi:hypothetical protein JQS43_24080 [Natronosporangium hydrolyticum]|uniref:Uncharacterized protein n=1 Tax=Natronosporangium hydrolyticum TaxID=2811111 RepID=A0A895YEE3_9ACTN|nr:hypothetical protein [Natronosporangium hydrolyticum]QSB14522.1 hypothetical protein JQS43_24080 [Natronosporangium hydrolyticum]